MIGLPPFGSQKELHFFVSKQEFSKPSKSHNYLGQMKKVAICLFWEQIANRIKSFNDFKE